MTKHNIDNLFFRTAVQQCNDMVVITDEKALIVFVNPAFEKHTGFKLKQIKGKNISLVKSGLHDATFYKKIWQKLKKGEPISQIFINKKKNGEIFYENKTITPIKNENGKIDSYLSTSKDVTEDLKLHNEIINKKNYIENIIQTTDALIVGLNKEGRIVLFNKACENITGYKYKEVHLKTVFDFLIPIAIREEIMNVFEGIKNDKFKRVEYKWITKANKEIVVRWSNAKIKNKNDDETLILLTGINITNEKQKESELMLLNSQLDLKVKERTEKVILLSKNLFATNKLISKINSGIPAIIYLVNVKTKKVTIINNSINESILLPEIENEEINFINFIKYFSNTNATKISLETFCQDKEDYIYNLTFLNYKFFVQNKVVVFENDSNNNPIEYLGFLTDISSTKIIQNRLETSQKIAHIGSWEWDIQTNEIYWSDETYRIFEVDPKLFKPSYYKFLETIYQKDRKLVEDAVNYSLENKTTYEITHRLETKPSKIKYVVEKGYAEYDLNGKPIRMIGTIRDITETELFKQRLEVSQKLAKIGTWEINRLTDEVFWSKQMYDIHNVDPDKFELNTENVINFVHPEDKQIILNHYNEAIRNKITNTSIDYRIITSDGVIKYISTKINIEYEVGGNITKMLGNMQDVTTEKLLKNKLQSAFVALENSLNAIFSSNLSGNIEYANKAAVKMWGYSDLEIMLKDKPMAFHYWHPEEANRVENCILETLKNGYFLTETPFRALKSDGEIALVKFNIVLIKNSDGKPQSLTGSFFDVTEEYRIKQEIDDNDKKLSLLLQNIDEVVYGIEIKDDNFILPKVFLLSGQAEDIIGFNYMDFKKDPSIWYKSIHPEDTMSFITKSNKAIQQKQSVIRLYRIFNKLKEKYIWLEDKTTPEFDVSGTLKYFYGSARDVTERINKDLLLKESEEKYRFLSDNNQDLISMRDLNGNPLFISNSVESMLGYTVEQYQKINLFDLMHPEDIEKIKQSTFNPDTAHKVKNLVEARVKHKNGNYLWMNTITSPVFDENGNIKHIIGSTRDVTERKNLEISLAENEKKYRSIFENALVGIFRTNIKTKKAVDVNDVCIKMFKYDSKEDFLNNFISSERYNREKERDELIAEVIKNGQIINKEIEFKTKDGNLFWGIISVKLLNEDGIIEGAVLDITERKLFEEQLKNTVIEKDLLLKEVHHRVKNNLQIISSLLKLQINKTSNPELKEPLQESRERIRAIALIHEKLYLSNDISKINFSDYLQNLTHSMQALNSGKKINVDYNLTEYLTDINTAIPLGLACYEIISNAFKHAFNNATNASITLNVSKTNLGYQIIISDTGKGFELNSIDPSKSLGWNLITSLTKQAKGIITIQSKIGVGSEFKIELN